MPIVDLGSRLTVSQVLLLQSLVVLTLSWLGRWCYWDLVYATAKSDLDRRRFSQTCMAACFHVTSGYLAWRVMGVIDWSRRWEVSPDVKYYYLLYAARYVADTISLCFEPVRSDTWAYAVHHIATIALVLGSAAEGYTGIGCSLMFFLDWADPPLLVAKACLYLSRSKEDAYQWWADRLFEVFAVVFVATRNLWLPYLVYRICREVPEAWALKTALFVLVILMKYWLVLIVKAAMVQQKDRGLEEIRETREEGVTKKD